jgi:cyclopropane-fatty-acyl-phospholipid synthase
MILEARIEKMVGELQAGMNLPLAIELWNGKRYALGERPTVTLRVPSASAVRYLAHADMAKLGEAYVEGHIDVDGPIGDAIRAAESLARHLSGEKKGRLPALLRRRGDPLPLRRLQRLLRAVARSADGVLVRVLPHARGDDLDDAQVEARPHLPQAAARARRAAARHRLRLGRPGHACRRHYGVKALGITLSQNQHELATERIARGRPAGPLEVRCRTTATSPARRVSTRSPPSACSSTSG